MKDTKPLKLMVFLVSAVLVATGLGCNRNGPGGRGPTEAEVKETIQRVLTQQYAYPLAGPSPTNVSFQFGPIQFGKPIDKSVLRLSNALGDRAYPVKVRVLITFTFANGYHPTYERGGKPDDVFYFYVDEFSKWMCTAPVNWNPVPIS